MRKKPSLGSSCNATSTDCLLHGGQGGFVEGGGSLGKVRSRGGVGGDGGPLTLTHPLSPGHLLGFHNGCECACEEGRCSVCRAG